MNQVVRAIHDSALETFVDVLQRESWLLGESHVGFQVGLIERATLRDRGAFISTLLDLNPALMRRAPATRVAGDRVRIHICEAPSHPIADSHLADA